MAIPKKRQPVRWHVYEIGGYYHVLSDTDLGTMDEQQRAAYSPMKLSFDTRVDAIAYTMTIAGQGQRVSKKAG